MRISVLILTKNRPLLFKKCLLSIVEQTVKPYEVVIVDGSSRDENMRTIKEFSSQLHLRHIHENSRSIAVARNIAIMNAYSDTLFFLDDDCAIHKEMLYKTLRHFKTYKDSIAVIGRVVNAKAENVYACVQQFYYERWLLQNFNNLNTVQPVPNGMVVDFEIAAIKKDALKQLFFDESIPFGRDEDVELGVRLFTVNRNIYFDPTIVAHHSPRTTFIDLMKRNVVLGYTNQYLRSEKGIDVRNASHKLSWSKQISLSKKAASKLAVWRRSSFYFLLFLYPLLSRLGRIVFKARAHASRFFL